MAESAIGRAALVLTTDASGAKSGLAKFGSEAKAWADKTGTQMSGQLKSAFLAGGVAGFARAALSCDAKLKSHAAVARISNPIVVKGVGMSRCAAASTNATDPPGLRITSTIIASVVAPYKAIARSSCASAIAEFGGDIEGIRRNPTRVPAGVVNVAKK